METGGVSTFTETTKIYRDGSKALVDRLYPPVSGKQTHTRTLYDLQAGKNFTWHPNDASHPCGAATFTGDWGDTFAMSEKMTADLGKQNPTVVGKETLNGFAVKVLEVGLPGGRGKAKLWIDEKYGLVVKSEIMPASGPNRTLLEIKQFSPNKPAASLFAPPAACGS
jgi:outer membrane lipoprotein-sorting protein